MRNEIDLQEVGEIINTISEYKQMSTFFTQMVGGKDAEPLNEYWNTKIVKRTENTWMTQVEFSYWNDVNLHIIKQSWSNTSGGWEGIGGSAITTSHTIIIENSWFGFACVYYHGKLAYICEMDEKYNIYRESGYRNLPGCSSCKKNLTIIFKTKH